VEKFKVAATGLSMNYMPEYLASEHGFFEEEGVEVDAYRPNPWVQGLEDINTGKADVVLGGIWVPVMYHGHIKDYMSIAKIASKCPLYIISKEKSNTFNWKSLENKRVLVSGGDGASHYIMTAGSAKQGGADVSKIRFIHDFSTAMICELFEGGFGDFIVVQPDMAQRMIEESKGYFFCDLATKGSQIPWSVYYGRPKRIQENFVGFEKFTAGLQRGTTFLLENGGVACQSIIEKYWPHISVDEGIKTIDRFIQQGMWTPSVKIMENELLRWQDFLVLGDVLDQPILYDHLVDNRPYEYIEKKNGVKNENYNCKS